MGELHQNPPRDGEGDREAVEGVSHVAAPHRQPSAATSPSWGGLKTPYLIALAIFVVDQISKFIIIGPLALQARGSIELLPIFNFTWVENRGISLGLGQASNDTQRWLLVAATAGIALLVAWWIRREQQSGDRIALALVLGGALGNIVDRVRLGFVVDFLDLHFGEWRPFLVFNVADAAISIGVVILLFRALFVRPAAPEENIHA